MNRLLKNFLAVMLLATIFLTCFYGHYNQMPQHVDSWQVISKADYILKQKELTFIEPFTGLVLYYPPGAHLHLSVISSIAGIDMIFLAQILPAIFFVMLGLLLYTLSKSLFKNELAAISVMAFTPLALSNITMLGPFYLVPLTWGMLLSLLFFYFIIKENWFFSFITFVALANIHNSSVVFSLLGAGLYFLFNKRYWNKIKYLFLFGITALVLFSFTVGYELFYSIIKGLFIFQKAEPYISIYLTMPALFLVSLALGFYLILSKEKKAATFLIPLFTFLAINAFIYWRWQGFFLVYRRLFTFTFMMTSFFVGYTVYYLSNKLEDLTRFSNIFQFIKKYHLALILFLIILVPQAVSLNIKSYGISIQYVSQAESQLFQKFGEIHPQEYLVAGHLESFALPYYNIKPVVLSPAHGVNTTYFPETMPCFITQDIRCFENFFNETNFEYLYTSTLVNSSFFEEDVKYGDRVIYKYKRK